MNKECNLEHFYDYCKKTIQNEIMSNIKTKRFNHYQKTEKPYNCPDLSGENAQSIKQKYGVTSVNDYSDYEEFLNKWAESNRLKISTQTEEKNGLNTIKKEKLENERKEIEKFIKKINNKRQLDGYGKIDFFNDEKRLENNNNILSKIDTVLAYIERNEKQTNHYAGSKSKRKTSKRRKTIKRKKNKKLSSNNPR